MPWTMDRVENVVVVGMNSHKVNVQNERFFVDLDEAFDRLDQDFADCAVVLRSASSSFSAGLDFAEAFRVMEGPDRAALEAWCQRYIATNLRIWQHPRPTVAAIHGAAIAGGLITALDCDFRIATPDARFSLNEVPIGIAFPVAYTEIVRHALGPAAASRLMLLGETLGAEAAEKLGIISALVNADELTDRAISLARLVPVSAFDAYAHTKRALQAPILETMSRLGPTLDGALLDVLRSPRSVAARAQRNEAIRGAKAR